MRYAKYDANGNVVNTIACEDAAFAERLGYMEYPYPERESAIEPTAEDDLMSMTVDHEYRITLLELGITEEI